MENRIERTIEIKAPLSRVWQALTNYQEFGTWFRAKIDQPFKEGQMSTGMMTYPGCEHLKWEAKILKMEKEKYFSFSWAPYVHETPNPEALAKEPWQLVEFHLEKTDTGTLLKVSESGFEKISAAFRDDARRGNEEGWTIQMKNIADYVTEN